MQLAEMLLVEGAVTAHAALCGEGQVFAFQAEGH